MFGLLKSQPVLDQQSIDWMHDVFQWALRNFDSEFFYKETVLIMPDNRYFPGRENNAHAMASLIFSKVMEYAGVKHWPVMLADENHFNPQLVSNVKLLHKARGHDIPEQQLVQSEVPFQFAYSSFQLNDPEIMIANFAQTVGHYLALMADEPPPGSELNWPHITELLAVYLGFGVIMANTAHTAKIRSCGSCSGPAVERQNFLSQFDITYALAIFCKHKDIPVKQVTPFLKKSLHSYFKKAYKDVMTKDA